MGTVTGGQGNIVTNGLVLNLDAANPRSYPQPYNGTAWTDLSGVGNNVTLVNGPIYSSDRGGFITFDGTNDYGNISNQTSMLTPTFTICSYVNAVSFLNAVIFTRENARLNLGISYGGSQGAYFFIRGSNYPTAELNGVQQSYNFQLNTWYHVTFIVDIPGNNYGMYVNGSQIWSSNAVLGTNFQNPGISGVIASRYGGSSNNANIRLGSFYFYNRVLSAIEVLQNFNATRARFGI
jgi:hypothetical protein